MEELLKRMRLLEVDHEPDGWPAVRMRDITALLDEVDRRFGIGGELIAARRERDAAQIENAKLRRVLNDAIRETLLDGTHGVLAGSDSVTVLTDTWVQTVIELLRAQKQCAAYGEMHCPRVPDMPNNPI